MAMTTYEAVIAYAKQILMVSSLACKTSIFNDPSNKIYTVKGKTVKIREVDAGNAGTYDPDLGWLTDYGDAAGVNWRDYVCDFDRAKRPQVDAIDEMASFQTGMESSIAALNRDFMDNRLPKEIDATTIAKWYSRIPAANRHINSETGYKVGKADILETLVNIEADVLNAGYDGITAVFMSSLVYAALKVAITTNGGLASGTMLKETNAKRAVELDSDTLLELNNNVILYGKLMLIVMPSDRMYTKVTVLDGKSEGQTAGGYVPNYDDNAFANIDLLVLPLNAAFVNIKYLVENFLIPANMPDLDYTQIELRELNQKMFGNVAIDNVGINQKAHAFEYDTRIIYGADVFEIKRPTCFSVTGVVGDQTVDTITVTGAGNATTIATDGGTLQMSAAVLPETAVDKTVTWSVAAGTGSASIDAAGLLTAVTNGTVVVTATANDGSLVTGTKTITLSNQS